MDMGMAGMEDEVLGGVADERAVADRAAPTRGGGEGRHNLCRGERHNLCRGPCVQEGRRRSGLTSQA